MYMHICTPWGQLYEALHFEATRFDQLMVDLLILITLSAVLVSCPFAVLVEGKMDF